MRRALVSVSDKTGLEPFVQGLVALGFEILSTGGTRKFLSERGVPVLDVAEYTGFPEIMDGRVKTLHPRIHGGLLGRPDLPEDAAAQKTHGITPIELVVVNLYPFVETIRKPGTTLADAIEQIDIGGPSMIRSAAKNHAYVGVVTRPAQYAPVLGALQQDGKLSAALRLQLAAAAFDMTARYDAAVADYLAAAADPTQTPASPPPVLRLTLDRRATLRYGENPHQQGAFYVEPEPAAGTLATAEILHGKELSYNNLLDLDAALGMVRELADPAAVVIKHNNPCGGAVGPTLVDAFRRAYAGDPVSAFGSVLGFNRPLDLATAEELCQPDRFVEAIIAPAFDADAFAALTTRPKWKNSVRLLACAGLAAARPIARDYRRVSGGLLVQDADEGRDPEADWKVVSQRAPTEAEWADLRFAWQLVKHVKSNAIVFVQDRALVGVGAGQMSRLDSVRIAVEKAGPRSRGAVVGSDAFFPFRDGPDAAAAAGVTALIEPGGSKRDDEVIAAANEHGLALVFTGRRHFRH